MQENIKESLFSTSVFDVIPASMQDDFLLTLDMRLKSFNRGDLLFTQGEEIIYLPVILKGSVRAEMFSASGNTLQIDVIKAPEVLAAAFVFASRNRIPVSVTALEDGEILKLSIPSLQNAFVKYPDFSNAFMRHVADRVFFLTEKINFLNIKTIKGKLAQLILTRSVNNTFSLPMNQTELSRFFGIERPSLARALSEIIQDKIITLRKNKGEILNIKQLKALLA
ncbi:MAG: Crp/Fnr family transcriptional regulator [Tannerella sp.]|jgi:CRP-like cAMP-binding protein|nr:Crp/Fnr family transcriptional regulator [Tannerella sp.]